MKSTVNNLDTRWVSLRVSFTALEKLTMMLNQVRTIILNIFYFLDSINNSRVSPFPVFLVLESTRVYIYILNHGNIVANVEAMIDEPFSINTTL